MYKSFIRNFRYQMAAISAMAISCIPLSNAHAVSIDEVTKFQKIADYMYAGGPPPPKAPVFDADTPPILRSLMTASYNAKMDKYMEMVNGYADTGDPHLLNPIIPATDLTAPAMPPKTTFLPEGHSFNDISRNMTDSLEVMPGLLSGTSYMLALMMGATAILKIKSHVMDPLQTPIREGALRLMAGGALLAMPIVYEAMFATVGDTATVVTSAPISTVAFNTTP